MNLAFCFIGKFSKRLYCHNIIRVGKSYMSRKPLPFMFLTSAAVKRIEGAGGVDVPKVLICACKEPGCLVKSKCK